MQQVVASAPGKLMLTGSYAVVHGEPCVVTSVDQRLEVTVRQNGVDVFHLEAPDLGLQAYSKTIADLGKKDLPKGVRFIEILYKNFLEKYPQQRGIIVTTSSEFSSSFGFGSSSAVTVAFAKALTTLYQLDFSNKELFDFCYQAVLEVQGVGSGFDIAAAIWGNTLYYAVPAKIVEPVMVESIPLVVGYTGIKADTPTLVRMVNNKLQESPQEIDKYFKQIGLCSTKLRVAMEAYDWQTAGQVLTQHQAVVRQLGVSSFELEKLISAAVDAGAYGATLSGAGGGDCMVALVADEKRASVESAIESAGGEVMHINTNQQGARIESE